MSNGIFRRTTVEKINAPEELNDYMRVVRPGVWLVLGAITLLLIGVIVWGFFGTVTSVADAAIFVNDGKTTCFIKEEDAAHIQPGMTVLIDEEIKASVVSVGDDPIVATEREAYILQFAGIDEGDMFCTMEIEVEDLELGVYKGEIEVERIRPVSFVIQ